MSERVVLVTGALAGIGRATATAFAREGAAVVVSGRRDEDGKAFAAELRALGAEAEYLRADVGISGDIQALVDGTVKTFGKLDVAVNNAGFTGSPGQLATQILEAYDAVSAGLFVMAPSLCRALEKLSRPSLHELLLCLQSYSARRSSNPQAILPMEQAATR